MKKLQEAYNRVKNHPYRIYVRESMGDDYCLRWQKLRDVFEEELKKYFNINSEETKPKSFFYIWMHEFYSSVWHLGYCLNKKYNIKFNSEKELSNNIIVLESYLHYIHQFLLTGIINEFKTYYYGGNVLKGKSRWSTYKLLNKKTLDYSFINEENL